MIDKAEVPAPAIPMKSNLSQKQLKKKTKCLKCKQNKKIKATLNKIDSNEDKMKTEIREKIIQEQNAPKPEHKPQVVAQKEEETMSPE